jgi:hypothetical protein
MLLFLQGLMATSVTRVDLDTEIAKLPKKFPIHEVETY